MATVRATSSYALMNDCNVVETATTVACDE